MFLKNLKTKTIAFLTLLLIIPSTVFAYSDYIIAGGQNIGIELNATGVFIVGTYEIGSNNPAKKANLQKGDKIISVNEEKITTIEEMLTVIETSKTKDFLKIDYVRNSKQLQTTLELIKDNNNIYKTGLYVKDSINGVGTLTFIDPKTKLYGALGHEIIEKTTGRKLEIKSGRIYNSTVTSITPSDNGNPGEKNVRYNTSNIYGNVLENTDSGIFGNYTTDIDDSKLYKVASYEEIKLGEAKIITVVNEEKPEEFIINILKISKENQSKKNILFEITDTSLLEKTGGIIQGMSGSPIIQDENIIGAVTHVVVDDCTKGYGIFITNMLEEAEN